MRISDWSSDVCSSDLRGAVISMSGTHSSRRRRRLWHFANADFDEASWALRVDGRAVALEGKPLEVLHELLLRAGEVVTKDEILDAVWPGLTVVEGRSREMGGIARRRALPPPLRPAVARNRARLRPARTRTRRHHPPTRRGLNRQRASAPPPQRSVPEIGRASCRDRVCKYV